MLINSPKPTPCLFNILDSSSSTLPNAFKSLFLSSSLIPTPVSIILIDKVNSLDLETSIVIDPFNVYLKALLIKFIRTCLILISSL